MESTYVELPEPRQIVFQTLELEVDNLAADQVYARTQCSAISTGTELAAYRGDKPLRAHVRYPRVVGYCNVAQVEKVGSAVSRYQVGDLILTFQSHRDAFICKESEVILKIPDGANLEHAATTFLYHLGYECLLKANFKPGHTIAVVGLGTLGLTSVEVARMCGAEVFAFSNVKESLQLAQTMGARKVYTKKDTDFQADIRVLTHEVGIDIVISTANGWDDWKLALELAREEGAISVLGFPGRGQPLPDFNPLEPQYLYAKKLSVFYCGYMPDYLIPAKDIRFTRKRNCEYLLDRILEGKLNPESIIFGKENWKNIEDVYKRIEKRDDAIYTMILEYS